MLCRTLGHGRWRHPDEMLAEMPAAWFDDWRAAYEADPWGEERADLRMARLCWAATQPHSKKKVREKDFLFVFLAAKAPPTPEEFRQKSMRMMAMQGGMITVKPVPKQLPAPAPKMLPAPPAAPARAKRARSARPTKL